MRLESLIFFLPLIYISLACIAYLYTRKRFP